MYFIAVISDPVDHPEVRARLTAHFKNLQQTGFAGAPTFDSFGDVLNAFDGTSQFGHYSSTESSFTLNGGYSEISDEGKRSGSWFEMSLDDDRLTVETDTFYPWPLYYGSTSTMMAVGNDVHAIAIALGLHELDERAVVELAAMQYWILGRYTTVKGIDRVWPGERVVLPSRMSSAPNRIIPEQVEQIPDYPSLEQDQNFNVEEHIKTTFQSLVDAIDGMAVETDNTVVGLSGGLDSRLTNLAISRAGATDVRCFTVSLEDGGELQIAASITERLGFEHETLSLPQEDEDSVRHGWLLTGGQAPLNAAAGNLTSYRMHLRDRENIRIVGAWPADLLIGAFVPSFAEFTEPEHLGASLKWWLAQTVYKPEQYKLLKHSRFARKHLRSVRRTILSQTNESEAPTAAQRISRWAFAHCAPTFTFVSPARLCANVQEVAPVMSRDFLKNLFQLRGVDLAERSFYQRMIFESGPELRDIRYHNTGHFLSPNYSQLPRMSKQLHALLKLPLGVFLSAKSLQARLASNRSNAIEPLVQDLHWDRIFAAYLTSPLKLTENLTVDPASEPDVRMRVKFASSTLGSAWTREYLRSFSVTEVEALAESSSGSAPSISEQAL